MSDRLASVSEQPASRIGAPPRLVFSLAIADLRHEWILSFCVAASLAAVLAPLLLLLGLKFGTIETLRDRLIQDPVNREIRPAQARNYTADWFKQLAQRPDVGFVTPTIARGAANVRIVKPASRDSVPIDMVPTAVGDPLVVENSLPSPREDEAILSTEALEQTGSKVGDILHVQANRFGTRGQEIVETNFRLVGVLPPKSDDKPRIYVPLQFNIDVEAYRRGAPVQSRGWQGAIQAASPSYDGVYIIVDTPFDALSQLSITVGTGFQELAELTPEDFAHRTGFPIKSGFSIYDLHVIKEPTGAASVTGVLEGLRGHNAIVIPYVREVTLTLASGATLPVVGWSLSNDNAARLGSTAPPWQVPAGGAAFEQIAQVLLPIASLFDGSQIVTGGTMLGRPKFPLTGAGKGPDGMAVVPATVAGMLRSGALREILYDADGKTLVLGRAGYGGFRLYARTIDDVLVLEKWFREQDIAFTSRAQDIDRIRVLDRGLTRMFWLVAVVGIVGGAAALIASLYASVQRKRRELGMMRLLGIQRRGVFLFPIYQSAILAAVGATIALLAYFALAFVINTVFAGDLNLGQKICRLPATYLATAVISMLIAAVLCATLAAGQTTKIDPADAIRDE